MEHQKSYHLSNPPFRSGKEGIRGDSTEDRLHKSWEDNLAKQSIESVQAFFELVISMVVFSSCITRTGIIRACFLVERALCNEFASPRVRTILVQFAVVRGIVPPSFARLRGSEGQEQVGYSEGKGLGLDQRRGTYNAFTALDGTERGMWRTEQQTVRTAVLG